MKNTAFDQAYYQRFYFEAATRVAEPAYFDRLADFIAAYIKLLGCPVETILDAGCGAGLLHPGLRRAWPQVELEGFDISEYACEQYGWQCASLESFDSEHTYDLVICHDVVQYLDRKTASKAIENLTRLTGSVLFFGVLTQEDWDDNCDQNLTDSDAHLRPSSWYRKKLAAEFRNAGGGVYVKRDAELVLYALESL